MAGAPLRDMAALAGCCRQQISRRAHAVGLPRRLIEQGSLPAAWIEAQYRDGRTTQEIRDMLVPKFPTLSRSTVATVLRMRGVQMRPAAPRAPHTPAECVRLLRSGLTRRQIAAKLGLSSAQVNYRIAKILGRCQHGGHKEVSFDHGEIEQLRRQGLSHRQIARAVGCSRQTVGKVLRDRRVA